MSETTTPEFKAHPKCWTDKGHVCQEPSGKFCIEDGCNEPAGTRWGPLWCPDHDVERLERVNAGFENIMKRFEEKARDE